MYWHTLSQTFTVLVLVVEVVWLSGGLFVFWPLSLPWPLTPDWVFLSADLSRLLSWLKICCILCPDTFTRFLRACTMTACPLVRHSEWTLVCVWLNSVTWGTLLRLLLWPEVDIIWSLAAELSWSVEGVSWTSVELSCCVGVLETSVVSSCGTQAVVWSNHYIYHNECIVYQRVGRLSM